MIPNFAPMAAVYLRLGASGSLDGKLYSRPVAAWLENDGAALVPNEDGRLAPACDTLSSREFLGLWQYGWAPTYDQMSSLLPPRTPGEPDPLATRIIIVELTSGMWEARRADDTSCVTSAFWLDALERKISAVGNFHIEKIIPLDKDH